MGFIRDWIPLGALLSVRVAAPDYAVVEILTFFKWGPRHPKDGYFTSYEEWDEMCFVWAPQVVGPGRDVLKKRVEGGQKENLD